jgi:MoaA/NifB/PqqE/SkfB family radical SAM enzyme
MNCTAKGEDMSFKTFKQAIKMAGEAIVIGGGEPTIHPQFEKFLFYAVANCDYVYVITNGKLTDKAIALARLGNKDNDNNECNLSVELSQDPYHEEIDERVIAEFHGYIRDTSHHLINAGRCDFGDDGCICEGDPFVKPNGDVYQCGCEDSPKVGDVFNGFESYGDGEWICHKNCLDEENEDEELEEVF